MGIKVKSGGGLIPKKESRERPHVGIHEINNSRPRVGKYHHLMNEREEEAGEGRNREGGR